MNKYNDRYDGALMVPDDRYDGALMVPDDRYDGLVNDCPQYKEQCDGCADCVFSDDEQEEVIDIEWSMENGSSITFKEGKEEKYYDLSDSLFKGVIDGVLMPASCTFCTFADCRKCYEGK